MSCRWTLDLRGWPDTWLDASGAAVVFLDLAGAGRKEDFCWLARSHGVPDERLDALWRGALARLGRASRSRAGL
jgi:hypothetical protein